MPSTLRVTVVEEEEEAAAATAGRAEASRGGRGRVDDDDVDLFAAIILPSARDCTVGSAKRDGKGAEHIEALALDRAVVTREPRRESSMVGKKDWRKAKK
jgi:hypothetical protein